MIFLAPKEEMPVLIKSCSVNVFVLVTMAMSTSLLRKRSTKTQTVTKKVKPKQVVVSKKTEDDYQSSETS